ncbi:MAG: hypothetical protein KDI30_10570 [Pseudomonadales bacterium]|nr:hypothetical protein [Pseudomonadales bacterium]
MLSKMDDYPIHQISDVVRHVATSDRNFYDRYYFNMHCGNEDIFVVIGMGQYPTLGVQDGFVLVRYGDEHEVVRASQVIEDRADIAVGPLRIEVLEGLQKLRIVLEKNDSGIEMDVIWEGEHYPFLEPRHYIRKQGRVLFDTMRFAQMGRWKGRLSVRGTHYEITPDRWLGSRDRSWGIRPVGEAEPQGIHTGTPSMEGMWNYFPVLFEDYALLYIVNENNDGTRTNEEAMRVWKDPKREPEWLGKPVHDHVFDHAAPLKARIREGVVRFPDAPGGPLELRGTPHLQTYLTIGTGYGFEHDWRHGMFQGKDPVTQHVTYKASDEDKMWGLIETPATFTLGNDKGAGMMEFAFFSDFDKYTKA